jgi:hypothetical protein
MLVLQTYFLHKEPDPAYSASLSPLVLSEGRNQTRFPFCVCKTSLSGHLIHKCPCRAHLLLSHLAQT